jgi:large subunit ribosomal protein L7A
VLEELKSNKKVVGVKQSIKAIEAGTVKTVFAAGDADEKIVNNIKLLCQNNAVQFVLVDNMKLLGKACSIEVGAAVACLLK